MTGNIFLENVVPQIISGLVVLVIAGVSAWACRFFLSKKPKFLFYKKRRYELPSKGGSDEYKYMTVVAIWNPGAKIEKSDITECISINLSRGFHSKIHTNNVHLEQWISRDDNKISFLPEEIPQKSGFVTNVITSSPLYDICIKGGISYKHIYKYPDDGSIILDGYFFILNIIDTILLLILFFSLMSSIYIFYMIFTYNKEIYIFTTILITILNIFLIFKQPRICSQYVLRKCQIPSDLRSYYDGE
ncbi:MAG: hypothetical protein IPI58_00905 [Alphaproteobacteria bacterium]|nr:MAG: hypothetical protein IPI58_00905 [Alphaproteobacteria bacterium]